ncbi:magnesium transporter CorA family protein [Limosilactobacillus sp. RRLNB_1_1]|uniref:Magnesium transporter CorA family protein n=1 Tax=Limosilactobacillus albertensis TaxID=2759752 RepID=A0A7W3Y8F7_9LACO|nr:magnesium transporter CorA family protein [Limosilactobacillus albertensis]MBB1069388.1 magnesium transporter CorA family protein [Limosilactobacillus albertensis]MCD7118580.1 magnesium transporter CorA family protein [Limosilactobacillus albertensis]MCD7128375.1 magnesium transporter CorA family protein [Limosilactobacillus albertensis]
MINKYILTPAGAKKHQGVPANAELVTLVKPSDHEIKQVCQSFDLSPFTFQYRSSPEEVSRFHRTTSDVLTNPAILVIYDFIPAFKKIENQLSPSLIVFDNHHLIICTDSQDTIQRALAKLPTTLAELLIDYLIACQHVLMTTLKSYKKEIDKLDQKARVGFSNDSLRALTTLTRRLVFFEHTMNDQATTITAFLEDKHCQCFPIEKQLELEVQQRRLTKTIHIFRDLLASISDLFTAMMDNHLNNLMQFLDSAGLIIAIAALVTGFMGMNVGGMPWKNDLYGFWLILGIALIFALTAAIFLRRKKYTK